MILSKTRESIDSDPIDCDWAFGCRGEKLSGDDTYGLRFGSQLIRPNQLKNSKESCLRNINAIKHRISCLVTLMVICFLPFSVWGEFQNDSEETLRQKAKNGDFDAMSTLCFWHIPDKLEFCEKAARQGDYQATRRLWETYEHGYHRVPQNLEKSLYWAQYAAEQGYGFGLVQLGLRYLYGVTLPQDDKEALKYFKKAKAYNWLGNMYEAGRGVKQDYAKAVSYYQKDIEDQPADIFWVTAFRMGWLTHYGLGVKQDEKAAQEWFLKAVKALFHWSPFTGIATAQSIGAIDASYARPEPAKEQAEIAEAQNLAQTGNANAQFYLGMAYNSGLGVKSDKREAINWWKKAAQNGHVQAMYNVGIESLPKDVEEAVVWLQKASDCGDVRATYVIGQIKLRGSMAKAQPDSKRLKSSASTKGSIKWSENPVEFREGLHLIEQSAGEGLSEAQGFLAIFYALDSGDSQNMKLAEKWWLQYQKTSDKLYVSGVQDYANPGKRESTICIEKGQ